MFRESDRIKNDGKYKKNKANYVCRERMAAL